MVKVAMLFRGQVLGGLSAATAVIAMLACSGPRPDRGARERRPSTPSSTPPVPPSAESGAALRVTLHGIGPIRAGMSVDEASSALGVMLELAEGVDATAYSYLRWPGGPDGVSVMRVDVRSATKATEEGARIGDSAERIQRLYAGRVTASPHKYADGQYLTVAPASPADDAVRLVFETEAGRVTRYRSGKLPRMQYVEGCS